MKRPIILALGGVAALALSAGSALADGYARGQVGAPQVRQQVRVHDAAPRVSHSTTTAHRWNAASGIHRSAYGYGHGGSNYGHVTGYSHGYTGVGYPRARVETQTVVRRSGGYYGDAGYRGGYYGYGYDAGGARGAQVDDQSRYFDYRYRASTDRVRQGFGRYQGGYATAYYGGGDYGGGGDGYSYTTDYGDRGGRYGYSEERTYGDYGYGRGYDGGEYGRDWNDDRRGDRDDRWDHGRDRGHDRRGDDDRREHWSRHEGQDGRRWECNCRETW
ncbi:hypothetical protein [Brevundimonas lutea]|uniref:hypothetical protein n=1 Tax=Brevundimonas lutea TaxID=2293980 RepID=UPI000F020499|nr:hypothetical protein [Brevundimonas lutea]